MHRYIILLLVLLLPCSALCETGADRLAQLDIIDQREERLQGERYFYKDMFFRIAGCKPASVTNALVALLGSSDTPTPELLVELRNGLRYDRSDKTSSIDLLRLPGYLQQPRNTATELLALLDPVIQVVLLSKDMRAQSPSALLKQFFPQQDSHPLLMSDFYFPDSWPWLIDMAAALCESGHPDARFALCTVGVGTSDTDCPFNLGTSGHYASLYFQADEFYRDGTFYLLDSYPRALPGEIHGYYEHYPVRYPFVERPRLPFGNTYTPTRISDTVIQFDLLPKELELLHNTTGDEHAAQLFRFCNTTQLFSTSYYMLYIP